MQDQHTEESCAEPSNPAAFSSTSSWPKSTRPRSQGNFGTLYSGTGEPRMISLPSTLFNAMLTSEVSLLVPQIATSSSSRYRRVVKKAYNKGWSLHGYHGLQVEDSVPDQETEDGLFTWHRWDLNWHLHSATNTTLPFHLSLLTLLCDLAVFMTRSTSENSTPSWRSST